MVKVDKTNMEQKIHKFLKTGHKSNTNKNEPCAKLPCLTGMNCFQTDKNLENTVDKIGTLINRAEMDEKSRECLKQTTITVLKQLWVKLPTAQDGGL